MSRPALVAPEWSFGPITRTDIVRYQGASGDFNPIHHDDGFARAAGYPTAFAPGMFQAGMLATYATTWLGVTRIRRFTVRFRDQVWPGDTLVFTGRVTGEVEGEEIAVELECRRSSGEVVLTGSAFFARESQEGGPGR